MAEYGRSVVLRFGFARRDTCYGYSWLIYIQLHVGMIPKVEYVALTDKAPTRQSDKGLDFIVASSSWSIGQ